VQEAIVNYSVVGSVVDRIGFLLLLSPCSARSRKLKEQHKGWKERKWRMMVMYCFHHIISLEVFTTLSCQLFTCEVQDKDPFIN
jgi:hypothetical protein